MRSNGNRNGTRNGTRRGGKRGFTLIEVLIVVVILGVLAALVVPSVTSALGDARSESAKARASQILTMITRYNQFNPSSAIPTTDGAISQANLDKLVTAGFCVASDLTNQVDSTKGWSFQSNRIVPTP